MLNFCIRHGMTVGEVYERISFKQSRWLEKYICFNTQKTKLANIDFAKDFSKFLYNAFVGKEDVRCEEKDKIRIY